MVEHLPHPPKERGSNPVANAGTWREKMVKRRMLIFARGGSTVVTLASLSKGLGFMYSYHGWHWGRENGEKEDANIC